MCKTFIKKIMFSFCMFSIILIFNLSFVSAADIENSETLKETFKNTKAEITDNTVTLTQDTTVEDVVNVMGDFNVNLNGYFEDLLKYAVQNFYNDHKTIKFTTQEEESTYEILAVFYSRVYYKSEQNVFRYYYFINANNEQEYNNFVNNAKRASIYAINVNAKYGDQLLTLSTCEYSQEDGRFVVVAKKINE